MDASVATVDPRPVVPAVSLAQVRKAYVSHEGRVLEAISDITLDLATSERVGIVGPSGCGKSSLLRILSGLDREYRGRLSWGAAGDGTRLVCVTVFQGESTDEIAARLGCSVRTVGSLWSFSRRWLESELDSAR